MSEYQLKMNTVPLCEDYDVVVCGGGPAGCAAAIAAAREGAGTLLIEATGMLGGMATSGMVNAFTPMTDGINVLYGGIAKKSGGRCQRFSDTGPQKTLGMDPHRLRKSQGGL